MAITLNNDQILQLQMVLCNGSSLEEKLYNLAVSNGDFKTKFMIDHTRTVRRLLTASVKSTNKTSIDISTIADQSPFNVKAEFLTKDSRYNYNVIEQKLMLFITRAPGVLSAMADRFQDAHATGDVSAISIKTQNCLYFTNILFMDNDNPENIPFIDPTTDAVALVPELEFVDIRVSLTPIGVDLIVVFDIVKVSERHLELQSKFSLILQKALAEYIKMAMRDSSDFVKTLKESIVNNDFTVLSRFYFKGDLPTNTLPISAFAPNIKTVGDKRYVNVILDRSTKFFDIHSTSVLPASMDICEVEDIACMYNESEQNTSSKSEELLTTIDLNPYIANPSFHRLRHGSSETQRVRDYEF